MEEKASVYYNGYLVMKTKKLVCNLPILVAEYMLSIGNIPPRPNNNTLAKAGINWVVVTSTFTQLLLEFINVKHLLANVSQLSVTVSISALN